MKWVAIASLLAVFLAACTAANVEAPATGIARETVPVTAEVTREVTRQVEVTRLVEITLAAASTPSAAAVPAISTPAPYSSAPEDGSLDLACRITIGLFFSYKKGFSIESYRGLFIPSSQYLADSVAPPAEARILLNLEPASQHWERNFPGTPMPGAILPEQPNEYVYYADFTYAYEPNSTPVVTIPDHITITLIADGPDSCKIKGYGKG